MQLLYALESIRTPLLDTLMAWITECGGELVFMAVAITMFWCVSKACGYYMLTVGFTGTILNQFLKLAFRIPRPWVKDPDFTIVESARAGATGYSFPSGHTTLAVGFYGGLANYLKRFSRWWILLCAVMAVLTAFSRNWLGAHTPQDVLVGLGMSFLFLQMAKAVLEWVEKGKNRDLILVGAGVAFCIAMLAFITLKRYPMDVMEDGTLLVDPWDMMTDCYKAAGALLGFLLGFGAERRWIRFDERGTIIRRILRFLFGAAVLLAVRTLCKRTVCVALDAHWGGLMEMLALTLTAVALYPALVAFVQRRKAACAEKAQGMR